jgi:hypothetical protein
MDFHPSLSGVGDGHLPRTGPHGRCFFASGASEAMQNRIAIVEAYS